MMKLSVRYSILSLLLLGFLAGPLTAQKSKSQRASKSKPSYKTITQTSPDGKYTYMTVQGDPLGTRIYYLNNGLTVYLTNNPAEPRIHTSIAVRAGSKNDPSDATGLAHYLEHMLFKGTDKYGTLDYEKEKELLDKIESLYEQYRSTKDEAERKKIYAEIDATSNEAAKFAIANEYDKMLSGIGAKGTNAYTSFEQTVYINDIPANQIANWLKIEGERFRNPVLRLFHTELEAVYEEKNISLDSDSRSHFFTLLEEVFPRHNYGQQTTIGTIDHLKNPSIKKIKEYYGNYYVPNNMAIMLSGDFNPDEVIRLIDQNFGYYQSKDVIPYEPPTEAPMTKVTERSIYGPEAEAVMIGYRFPGTASDDARVLEVIDLLLSNSSAGLIDLNLNQQQKVLSAYSNPMTLKDYSVHVLYGSPREGQSLEEVRDLLLDQINLIKKGEFEEGMLRAIVNNTEIEKMQRYESNYGRTSEFVEAFTTGQDWSDYVQRLPKMREITKDDIVRVANKYYQDNYAVVYKRKGERTSKKVVKPEITPVSVNRDARSEFLASIVDAEPPALKPRFINYDEDIVKSSLSNGINLHYVRNQENTLFTQYYLLDIGSLHDRELAFAIQYLPLLGTDEYTAEELAKMFYELGVSFDVNAGSEQSYVTLTGINANYEKGVKLFEHVLANAQPNEAALEALVQNTLKQRQNAKANKALILRRGMAQYGMYGEKNPFNSVLSEEELKGLKASDLTDRIHQLTSYPHRVLYYGPAPVERVKTVLNEEHKVPSKMLLAPADPGYKMVNAEKNKIYFVHYDDMVQAEVLWLSRGIDYDPGLTGPVYMFNEYFGGGMSSIVFQTIRESKALAYSTNAYFGSPRKKEEPFFIQAYVGTQADKLGDAMESMFELLTEIPQSENMFAAAKAAIKSKIESERIIRTRILFDYESALRRGVDRDLREDVYRAVDDYDFDSVRDFHKEYVSGKNYTMMILGSRDKVDLEMLKKYGEVEELTLDQVFGY